ncbi:MAG: hypothetical protein M1836_003988 [Candelina mexicana]|nr:MAG: hypothetical protein M1836_003988 [Candelina mexicana]
MGRRKIEIKAIKDDRNRSVTFLKRKGGLFKKAHELSVLCSVDVAVIIFGHNKKLYEFSSGDIHETIGRYQYYGNAHEHKGPADFNGKKDMDDDDDEDMSPPPESHSSQDHPMIPPHHLQHQPGFQHMRQQAPSASPPISNGILPNGLPFHHRHSTPQPQQVLSRPGSRNNVRRQSSLVPQNLPQTTQPPNQNGFAYMPNPPIYNPQAGAGMPVNPQQAQQAHFQYPHPPPHPQAQTAFMGEQRRESMPPTFPQQERPQNIQESSPPQQERQLENNQHLQKPAPAKSRSIFTPIDDSRSLLAQYWGSNTTTSEAPRSDPAIKTEGGNRAQSVDVGLVSRNATGPTAPPPRPQRVSTQPQRTASMSSDIRPISRTNTGQANANRPKLSVQIPSEHSDAGSGTAESSPRESANTGDTPAKAGTDGSHSSGVVLPPPSPSASAILSAGAQGPPNPFARPHPPNSTANNNANAFSNNNNNNNIETPISALPSRFMSDGLLPSPSSFYPDWDFSRGGGNSNLLPSPLNFQTPVVGPNFLREDEGTAKRKSPEGEISDGGNSKRVKI